MSVLSVSWRKLRKRWLRRGIDRRHALRRWLIDYVVDHGFEIGDFSFGSPEVRYYDDGCRLIVGKFCSIAESSIFLLGGAHRTDFASTYPFGEMTRVKGPSDQARSRGDIVVGHDVWVAVNATVLSGVTIGHGAAIGAGSVVIDDVPPYAIVFGNPARVVSKRFSDDIIAELLDLRWWDLGDEQVRALRPQIESTDIKAFIAACRAIRSLPSHHETATPPSVAVATPIAPAPPPKPASSPAPTPAPKPAPEFPAEIVEQIVALIQKEQPEFAAADLGKPFDRLGIDSFGMLMIRTHIEDNLKLGVDDARWSDVVTPADIVAIVAGSKPQGQTPAAKPLALASSSDGPLWTPSPDRAAASQLMAFMAEVNTRHRLALKNYRDLHRWSVENPGPFWQLVWERCGVIGEMGQRAVIDAGKMPGAKFFPDARLNFAENLLRRNDAGEAIVFRSEDKVASRRTWAELGALVSRMQQALQQAGIGEGDRVAAMLANQPEAIAFMLAATSIGAIWSSCSPDFGERGVLDRFGQIAPKLFIAVDGYWNAGKAVSVLDKLKAIVPELPSAAKVVVVPLIGESDAVAMVLPRAVTLDTFLEPFAAKPLAFKRLPFDHPAFILYSSGTTGVPKCIVHGAGGTLLQHLKEHRLQCDVRDGDRMFYQTTCGWMMWNWLVSGLASGATIVLYDGSPFSPNGAALWDYAQQERVTLFGTSAKYLEACSRAGLEPARSHKLAALRLITSTGSPLVPESFDYVYRSIKKDVQLASISGGTDIIACFVGTDPTGPVWRGEIQAPLLGMAVDVWSEQGKPLAHGKGELVCTKPFISMPVMFWNDADGAKYRAAYFERFPGVWHQGDFAEWTSHGGLIIHGRSDATLNPGGIRFGTADIYAAVGRFPEVIDSICVGQDWNKDVRVVLFVRLKERLTLDEALRDRIRQAIRANGSASHVPAKIIQVADVPRTRSGKLTELAVRDVVHGRPVKNVESLANPGALDCYKDIAELRA